MRDIIIFKSGPNAIVRRVGKGQKPSYMTATHAGAHRFASVREAKWFIDKVDADRKARRAQRRARRITKQHRRR